MKITTLEVAGLEVALTKAQRNPMNSWGKSDSEYQSTCTYCLHEYQSCRHCEDRFVLGSNDKDLAQRLIKGGSEHRKMLRQIRVWADVDMPRYWWSEYDTYKIGTNANSCSTMHKLLNNKKPITKDMFITHDLIDDILDIVIARLEEFRLMYMGENPIPDGYANNDLLVAAKRVLSEGFLQLRTVDLSYENLRNMYFQRRNHRLKEEWVEVFCSWIESLPYAKELIMYEGK